MVDHAPGVARIRRAHDDNTVRHGGVAVSILIGGEDSEGQAAVMQTRESRGSEPPRHIHHTQAEIIYVLEGALTFYLGDDPHMAPSGTCIFVPAGVEHSFVVDSGEATLLLTVVPAGFENCIRELSAEESRGVADGRTFVERMVTTNARYDTEITGPPLTSIAW